MKPLAFAALAAFSMHTSFAQSPERKGPPQRPLPLEILLKYDADRDDKLSKEELEKFHAEKKVHRMAMVEKYDTNKDGKLSQEERAVAKEDHRKALLAKYDLDHDGKLSDSERAEIPRPHPVFLQGSKRHPGGGKAHLRNGRTRAEATVDNPTEDAPAPSSGDESPDKAE